jgi:hypothetical protein
VTTGEAPSTDTSTVEELQQIPAMITVTEVSVATDARDKLLAAIGHRPSAIGHRPSAIGHRPSAKRPASC